MLFYRKILLKHLKDVEQAIAYLNAAIEKDDRDLLCIALKNATEATEYDRFAALHQAKKLP